MSSHVFLFFLFGLAATLVSSESDSLWKSSDDLLLAGIEWPSEDLAMLPSDQEGLPFEQAQLPSEQGQLPLGQDAVAFGSTTLDLDQTPSSETEHDIFTDVETNQPILFDTIAGLPSDISLADCAASESDLSFVGKSRRKRDSCKDPIDQAPSLPPLSLPFADSIPDLGGSFDETLEILRTQNPPLYRLLLQSRQNRQHNMFCFLWSSGVLPFGVCSSGNPLDVKPSNIFLTDPSGINLPLVNLDYCSPGQYSSFIPLLLV